MNFCGGCRYFEPGDRGQDGECHQAPPVAGFDAEGNVLTGRPSVAADDRGCARWAAEQAEPRAKPLPTAIPSSGRIVTP